MKDKNTEKDKLKKVSLEKAFKDICEYVENETEFGCGKCPNNKICYSNEGKIRERVYEERR